MSDLQGRRIPGEEDSGRKRPVLWIVLGLVLLLLLAVLIPFACQAMGGGQGGNGGQGAQGGAEQGSDDKGAGDGAGNKARGDKAGGEGGTGPGKAAPGETASDGGGERSGGSGGTQEAAVTRLSARDQSGGGAAVTVPAATLEGTKGWLAVRADDGGGPGAVLGHAPLKAGANEDVRVELDRPLASSQRLYATVHAESPADGKFTFPADDPTATRGGRAAVQPISYTVDDGAPDRDPDGGPDRVDAGIREDELPESGGIPPAGLLAAGTLLLASSVVGLSLSLRRANGSGS